jgi:hypothetical protein
MTMLGADLHCAAHATDDRRCGLRKSTAANN